MPNLLWENKVILCDICKERPMIKNVEINRGNWKGVCAECEQIKRGVEISVTDISS